MLIRNMIMQLPVPAKPKLGVKGQCICGFIPGTTVAAVVCSFYFPWV